MDKRVLSWRFASEASQVQLAPPSVSDPWLCNLDYFFLFGCQLRRRSSVWPNNKEGCRLLGLRNGTGYMICKLRPIRLFGAAREGGVLYQQGQFSAIQALGVNEI